MHIIGISGYARSGKDEAASVLVQNYRFTRVAFADKLREALYALDPTIIANYKHHGPLPTDGYFGLAYRGLQDVIDEYGWDGYKSGPFSDDIRRLLQRMGTEVGREILGGNIWVDAALTGLAEDARVVVTDVRFENEAQAIKDLGGEIWRVKRDGIGPAVTEDGKVHKSETSLDNWNFDYTLRNNSDLESYRRDVADLYEISSAIRAYDTGG